MARQGESDGVHGEELPSSPVGTAIPERLADHCGKWGEHLIVRPHLRGMAARILRDVEFGAVANAVADSIWQTVLSRGDANMP